MSCKWPCCACKATGVKCDEYRDPKKKKAADKRSIQKELKLTDFEFYMKIWNSRPHYCSNPSCNVFLGHEFRSYFMDHILEKGSVLYKHLRHEPDNICILCIQCHSNKNNIPFLKQLRLITLTNFGLQ